MFTTLRAKIYAGFAAIIAINVAFGLWSIYQFQGVGESIDRTFRPNVQLASTAVQLVSVIDEQRSIMRRMAETRSESLSPRLFDDLSETRQLIYSIQLDSLISYQHILPELRQNLLMLQRGISNFQQSIRESEGEPFRVLDEDIDPTMDALRHNSIQLLSLSRSEIYRSQSAIDAQSKNALFLITLSAAVTAIIGLVGGGFYSRWAIKPINRLNQAVKNLSGGRMGERILITTADELGDLTFEFNRLVERLHHYDTMNIEQLLVEKRKVETIVHSIATPIIVVNAEMETLLINSAAVTLLNLPMQEQFEGKPITEFIDEPHLLEALRRALDAESNGTTEAPDILVIREEGNERFYAIQALPLETTFAIRGVVAVFSDITHFKALDRLKSDFIAKVSHEFRTPLSSIMMSTDILREGIVGEVNEAQIDLLVSTKEDCKRLSKLITDLLEISRLESNEHTRPSVAFELETAVGAVVKSYQVPAAEKGVMLDVDLSGDIGVLWGDPEEFRWIFNNLIGNALRHTSRGGSVTVRGWIEGEHLLISVADTGDGIPLESLSRIFDKFYQVEHSAISTPGSVGLGLAITRDVVERYGGRISVTSELHKGTTFLVRMPLTALSESTS